VRISKVEYVFADKNFKFEFNSNSEEDNNTYSLILGNNGSGKSTFFEVLLGKFSEEYDSKEPSSVELEEGSLMYDKAIVVDWTDISLLGEFGGEDLGKLLSKENYQQIFSKLGITDESEVLVYGFTMPEQGFGDEARVLYTFSYAGFDNVKFIDGGYKQVEKLGFNKNYKPSSDRIDVSDIAREEATQNEKAIYTDELLSKIGNNLIKYQLTSTISLSKFLMLFSFFSTWLVVTLVFLIV